MFPISPKHRPGGQDQQCAKSYGRKYVADSVQNAPRQIGNGVSAEKRGRSSGRHRVNGRRVHARYKRIKDESGALHRTRRADDKKPGTYETLLRKSNSNNTNF